MEGYSIHKLNRKNFNILIPLMKDCFGMNVDLSYFEWKYLDNPAGFVEGYYAICNKNNEVAAYYGGIAQNYFINGKSIKVIQSCDTMTHSMHRRKGLFQMLVKHCDNELALRNELFIIGFGGSKTAPGYLKYGWKKLFKVKNYFLLPIFIHLFYRINKQFSLQINKDLIGIEHLLELNSKKISKKNKYYINRSFDFYNWRIKNPLHTYKVAKLKHEDHEQISSYIIYYTEENKIILFDFYFHSITEGQSLIKSIYNHERAFVNIKGVTFFCQNNSIWRSQLLRLNFISNPLNIGPLSEKMFFVINSNFKDDISPINPNSWSVNSFDHDCL